jgi:hypothetical protein
MEVANYYHQREQSRGKNSGPGYLKDITCTRCAIIIPNGVSKGDIYNAALCKAYLTCPDFRNLDNLLLQVMLIKTASDLYESTLTKSNIYPVVPTD